MTESQKTIWAATVILGSFVIDQIDQAYIIPKMMESDLRSKVQCHDYLDKCWIQERSRK